MDDQVVLSIGHPDLSEVGSQKTKNSSKADRESRKRAHKLEEDDTVPSKQKLSKPRRLTNVDVSDFLVKHGIKRDTELFAAAKERKDEGQIDLANFILSKSSKPVNDKYAWVGADYAEAIVLQDFRWSREMIPWNDLLLLLERETVKLLAPKNQFSSDVIIEKDTPIFATSESQIAYMVPLTAPTIVYNNKGQFLKCCLLNIQSLRNKGAEFADYIYESETPPTEIDTLVSSYNTTLSALLDRYAPVKTNTVTVRPKVLWYTEEILKAKIERRRAERKWRSSVADSDVRLFKKRRNRVTYLLKMAKSFFLTAFIDKNSDDQGKLFKALKNLLVEKEKLSFCG
ncbi:Hypothetical predicted protein [Paramuricea clavata]|uniref:Uncharacterized protein n=1 Tax=Paramuricea clavata TaxID=317549 RepID=A0A6S7FRL2_PARCT|nr:Hypothetical predicted protein [Paramuricea clavata]